jgi:cobalt ECF transporter T component CbiQ
VIVLALLDSLLIIVIGAAVIAAVTPGAAAFTLWIGQWGIVFSDRGIAQGVLVLARSVAGVTVMLFFATSTPVPHLAHALRGLRVPREITELIILVYRYSFLVLEQSERMFLAARCRLGFRGLRTSLRTFSQVAVGMFVRSVEVAERSQVSLYCRNFQGDFPTYRPPARATAPWLILPVLAFAALYLLDRLLQGGLLL